MRYCRILTIQDISCVGQCSMTVAMPVLSACGHETCVLPTALLSTHTGGFGTPEVWHLSGTMASFREHWQRAGITFDAILTGYLGSVEAIREAAVIMDTLLAPGGKVIVDPAMADHGRLYSGLSEEYAREMIALCLRADVMLPNLTEAAMMTGMPLPEQPGEEIIRELLAALGGRDVVLTGAVCEPDHTGVALRQGSEIRFYRHEKIGGSFHGTGDLFAACFTGAWLAGKTMEEAVAIAGDVTCGSIRNTVAAPAHWYGLKFETALAFLSERIADC